MILVSILLIAKPETMLNTVVTVFGIGMLLDGIFSIVLYIATDKEQKVYSNALAEGILRNTYINTNINQKRFCYINNTNTCWNMDNNKKYNKNTTFIKCKNRR